ncbi:hypothetical protein C8N42_104253 [Celeribacter persicus]|uniref:Uncharacterized protein n=1 Tax=Celeribacter persicus TaxID=1651082 RepID=A0A2T5HSY5_9RHOB|nr:hypothetical protein C8N42_104253 [Celeribacter persicus]
MRCSLPTSNAFSALDDSDCAAHAAFKTSSPSQQSPKTSGSWPSSGRWFPQWDETAGGTRHPKIKAIACQDASGPKSFSTESNLCGHGALQLDAHGHLGRSVVRSLYRSLIIKDLSTKARNVPAVKAVRLTGCNGSSGISTSAIGAVGFGDGGIFQTPTAPFPKTLYFSTSKTTSLILPAPAGSRSVDVQPTL